MNNLCTFLNPSAESLKICVVLESAVILTTFQLKIGGQVTKREYYQSLQIWIKCSL